MPQSHVLNRDPCIAREPLVCLVFRGPPMIRLWTHRFFRAEFLGTFNVIVTCTFLSTFLCPVRYERLTTLFDAVDFRVASDIFIVFVAPGARIKLVLEQHVMGTGLTETE